MREGALRPLSLASVDFDRDGVPDLVAGYGKRASGVLVLYRGNIGPIYPNSSTGHDGPFLLPGVVIKAPVRPDLLLGGDFDADGAMDLAMASTGAHDVTILRGDGTGGFEDSRRIALPGVITAMAAGETNRVDGRIDLVVGIKSASAGRLLLFQSHLGVLSALPDTIDLPASPTSILLGNWDGDAFPDVAAIAGRNLIVVHGRDGLAATRATAPAYVTERAMFPGAIAGGATGDFDADLEPDIALLFTDGSVRCAAFRSILEAVRGGKAPVNAMPRVPRAEGSSLEAARGARLTAAKVSSGPGTDLLLTEPGSGRIRMLASPLKPEGADAELELEAAAPKAVLPMRLNADGLADLVSLNEDSSVTVALTAPAAVYTVTNTLDGGPGSLRSAIEQANGNPGADLITFNILPAGSKTIQPASSLPGIFEAVTIDGTSQPGFTGTPIIELDGAGAGSADGLDLYGSTSVIRGLAINRWTLAIYTSPSSTHVIEGNYIGVDFTGSVARANTYGVLLYNGNTCGGTTTAARNVVSGNAGQGIVIYGSNNIVKSNFIGSDSSGSTAVGNFTGVKIWDGSGNQIGGSQGQNLISGNSGTGIEIGPGSGGGNLVQENLIGTNLNCLAALPNGLRGIEINATFTNNIYGNVISGNAAEGVLIVNAGANGNAIFNNQIGVTLSDAPLGNGKNGIRILDGTDNRVGLGPHGGNTIANNGEPGVFVGSGTANQMEANRIFGNAGLGIDLGPGIFSNGVTLNDADDTDAGANGLQNFPNLATASTCNSTTKILTGFGSRPSSSYRIDYFANPSCDPTGWGEGKSYLPLAPTVTTGGTGGISFEINQPMVVPGEPVLTATATDASGNTSEFSGCLQATDLTPTGEVTNLAWQAGKTNLSWQPVSGATTYRVQRGVRADLPNLLTSSLDACWRFTTQTTSTGPILLETPPAGSLFWYLVTPAISYCEGSPGSATAGSRIQNSGSLCADGLSCQHPHCDGGVQLAPTCDPCVAAICAQDPYCCNTNWDSTCIGEVRTICGSLTCPASQVACAHSLCATGGPLAAGCDEPPIPSCVSRVCGAAPACCSSAWDAACVALVAGICGQGCY